MSFPRHAMCVIALVAVAPTFSLHAETFVVRPQQQAVSSAVVMAGIASERYCHASDCIVLVRTPSERAALAALADRGAVTIEPLPDAGKVFFRRATYDALEDRYSQAFPDDRTLDTGVNGQFGIVLKSYLEPSWTAAIGSAGFLLSEPVSSMAYLVYGPRQNLAQLRALPYVQRVFPIPAGLKRTRVDEVIGPDDYGPRSTIVLTYHVPDSVAFNTLLSLAGQAPRIAYRMGILTAYDVDMTREDAIALSTFPEVVSVTRNNVPAAPSDERANRIVGGTWQTPNTSWPLTALGTNPSPYYWDTYLGNLAGIGVASTNQTIGFLDSGINLGLQEGGAAVCPPYLVDGSGNCHLVFTTDLTQDFSNADLRANDYYYHGTFTSALAAGFTGSSSNRDTQGYAFGQGVAPGVRVAAAKFFRSCTNSFYNTVSSAEGQFTENDLVRMARYAFVELTRSDYLPDQPSGPIGPGATILNSSWNESATPTGSSYTPIDYTDLSVLYDQTARTMSAASFNYGTSGSPNIVTGGSHGVLHVISAGNVGEGYTSSAQVTEPATAKNGITVGATESYNQQSYSAPANCSDMDSSDADFPRQLGLFSRHGYPNERLKPDLVAPAVRIYGPTSAATNNVQCNRPCFATLQSGSQYGWWRGTSFSAPIATGAAALTRAWLQSAFSMTSPSPAMVKATLIASAKNLVAYRTQWATCCEGGTCWDCNYGADDMRPTPDQRQGWGGLSLDRLFRATSNYYLYDQSTTLTPSQSWSHTSSVVDSSRPISIALVWTDRASSPTVQSSYNLVNDLDLRVTMTGSDLVTHTWYGNLYYTDRDDLSRTGYSLRDPSAAYDRKNNVERIDIDPSQIPAGATSLTITVNGYAIVADGISPTGSTQRQDFAVAVENAH